MRATILAAGVTALAGMGCAGEAPGPDAGAAEGAPPALSGLGPLDALGRRFGRVRQRVRNIGLTEEIGFHRVFVPEESGVEIPLDLATDDCTTLVALGGSRLRDLALTLYDTDGRELAGDAVPGEGGLVHACPQPGPEGYAQVPVHLVVFARDGSGAVVFGGFRGRPEAPRGFDGLFEGLLSPRVPVDEVEAALAESLTPLRARGLEPVLDPDLATLAEGGVLRRTARLERDRCYVVLARGGRGIADLDLILFDPSGAEVARDLEADAEPRIEHCPAATGSHTVEVRPYEGAGAVGWMLLAGPGPGRDEADPATPEADPGDRPDPVAALGATAASLATRGYDPPLFLVRGGFLAPGESRAHEILLGPGCAVVLGTAADPGVDLDLYLARFDGQVVDRDTRVQPMARVGACPRRAETFRATVKSYGREGTYALATMRPPGTVTDLIGLRLEEATAAFPSRPADGDPTPPPVTPERLVEREMGEGERWTEPRRLPPMSCVTVLAAGDEGVTDLDLLVRNAAGDVVASDAGPAPYAGVVRCNPEPTVLSLEVEVVVYRGRGTVRRLTRDRRETEPRRPSSGDTSGATP